jgi:hypothetical protein
MIPLEELVGRSGTLKVVIHRRPDGLLQLVLSKWYTESVPEHDFEASGWQAMPEGPHLTDSLDIARTLARELLAAPVVLEDD